MSAPLLDVRDLKVHFRVKTQGALIGRHVLLKALDGVSFSAAPSCSSSSPPPARWSGSAVQSRGSA
jgi:hypothetical protein